MQISRFFKTMLGFFCGKWGIFGQGIMLFPNFMYLSGKMHENTSTFTVLPCSFLCRILTHLNTYKGLFSCSCVTWEDDGQGFVVIHKWLSYSVLCRSTENTVLSIDSEQNVRGFYSSSFLKGCYAHYAVFDWVHCLSPCIWLLVSCHL